MTFYETFRKDMHNLYNHEASSFFQKDIKIFLTDLYSTAWSISKLIKHMPNCLRVYHSITIIVINIDYKLNKIFNIGTIERLSEHICIMMENLFYFIAKYIVLLTE